MYTYESPKPPSGLSMDQFDYVLPEERIGQEPVEPRDSARLLVSLSDAEEPQHKHVFDLPDFVRPGDVIVLNETRVIPARILLAKPTGGIVEVMLVDVLEDGADGANGAERAWKALVRPSRKVKVGSQFLAGEGTIVEVGTSIDGGQRTVKLRSAATSRVFNEAEELLALEEIGRAPLPPYITTPLADASRYQTTFARIPGSSAAPTAGLHLTEAVLDACVANGAVLHRVELCVGLDTFRPVSVDRPEDHEIHSERFRVPVETLEACRAAKARGGRVIAVGTTAVRALESAAVAAEPSGRTKLFIYGNYHFALVDILLTNFHLPRSSLLLLVDAFAGPRWRALYELAKLKEYRFLSFGDAMLLSRNDSVLTQTPEPDVSSQ
jgi:S-adenosylmethionine:tRNA ribosyltransferase-isomerase